ncbi:MAG: PAS domain S-box protein [Deltaproteobacteria bacterium]|uniref:histidine kinase n=1 Tax=Candidatus Zymogenus saltonus TaxID=2844893 RepID=A0A9D8KFT8_9DELT|nr:PAS domain S-box protein [Candidatus Zymogenus saltonus]
MKESEIEKGLRDDRQSMEFCETLLGAFVDGIAITTPSQKIIMVNKEFSSIFGVTPGEMTDTSIFDWLKDMEGDASSRWMELEKVIGEKGECRNIEFSKTDKDSIRYFNVNASLIGKAVKGEEGVTISIWHDFTEKHRIEEELAKASDKWQTTFDAIGDLVAIIDGDYRIIRANKGMLEFFGKEKVVGRLCYDLFHGTDRPIEGCPHEKTLMSCAAEHMEIQESRLGNRWLDVHTYPIKDERGRVVQVVHTVSDVTDKKMDEETLRESEQRLELALRGADLGLWDWNFITGEVVRDRCWAEMHGYTIDEIGSEELLWQNIIHPDDKEKVVRAWMDHFEGRTPFYETEHRVRHKSGKWIWVLDRGMSIKKEGGPVRAVGTQMDITSRKEAEETIRIRDSAIHSTISSIVLAEPKVNSKVTYVNPMTVKMWGYDHEEEIIGRSVTKFWRYEEEFEEVAKALIEKGIWKGEMVAIKKDGSTFDAQVSINVVLDDFKKPISVIASIIDITEKKRAEEALRESEERLRSTIDSMNDMVFLLDKDGVFIERHKPSGSLKSHSNDLFIGKSFKDVFPKKIAKLLGHAIEDVLKSGEVAQFDYSMVAGDEELWYDAMVSGRRDIKNEFCGVTIVARDITDRKRFEAALNQAHRELEEKARALELANEELTQYAHIVSHDLKAPLRAIHNYSDFLQEDLKDILKGDQKVYIEALNQAVRHGEELVDDLLEYSRLERKDIFLLPINIGEILGELISSLSLPEDVEIIMGDDWPEIEADPVILKQIFQNLIDNAVKFNTSKVKRIELGWRPYSGDFYEFYVKDNGIGIAPRFLDKIFSVFMRLHTKREYEGTGIGLAIVKKAVNKLKGKVRVESDPNVGSTFIVILPKSQVAG